MWQYEIDAPETDLEIVYVHWWDQPVGWWGCLFPVAVFMMFVVLIVLGMVQ